MPVRRLGWVAQRQRSFLLGMAPALRGARPHHHRAGHLPGADLADAAQPDAAGLGLGFQQPGRQLHRPARGPSLHALGVGAGQAVGRHRDPAAAGRARRCPAAQRRQPHPRAGALGLPHSHGAAADRGRHPVAGHVCGGHQPVPPLHGLHRPAGSLADHRSQLGAVCDRHRRDLGVVSVHDADGAGRAADDPGLAAGGGAHRRRQQLADLPLRDVSLHPADAGGGRHLPPDRQHQGVPSDLRADRRRARATSRR